ncbi:MAG: PTS sugar transporter subunit IIB [Erysipelotrichaceae bacterium]
MAINKIMCCCGSGLGSSMLVRLNVESVLKELGFSGIEVIHTSVSDATPGAADLFVVGSDLQEFTKGLSNVVTLDNIIDKNELREKLKEKLV